MKYLSKFNESLYITKGIEFDPDVQDVKDVIQDLIDEDFTRIVINKGHVYNEKGEKIVVHITEITKGKDIIKYTISLNQLLDEIMHRLKSMFDKVEYNRGVSEFSSELVHKISITLEIK